MLASDAGVEVGDPLPVLGRDLVVERIAPGGNPIFELAFVSGEDAPSLLGTPGYTSFYLLGLDPTADPAKVGAAAAGTIPGAESHTSEEYCGEAHTISH